MTAKSGRNRRAGPWLPPFGDRRHRRIGLLGGSFNPAHAGHAHLTRAALQALALDQVWWLVSPQNPLKPTKGMAAVAQRLADARALAATFGGRVVATGIEARLGVTRTVLTLAALKRRYPAIGFVWLMGADNLAQFHRWRDWRRIARQVPIAVIARPGYERDALRSPAYRWFGRFVRPSRGARNWTEWRLPALVLLRFRPDPTSATALRSADPDWFKHPRKPAHPPEE